MTTTEKNKLIAEFMGWKVQTDPTERFFGLFYSPNKTWSKENELAFHSSWDWLMTVAERIEEITDKEGFILYDFTIFSDAVIISDQLENPLIIVNKSEEMGSIQTTPILFTSKIEAVYNACVEFILWYNKQNPA